MKLFCDSGAYSSWANNSKIDIYEYIDFIQENKDLIEVYACLDDITDPAKTWKNQRIMEDKGLHPLPVYHVDEDDYFLERAMEYDYFGVGGMALNSQISRRNRFNYVFSKICLEKNDYFPTHKIHGFGLASPDLLIDYPWFSVDSSSWAQYGKFGIIIIPKFINGKAFYNTAPYIITISSRSKAVGNLNHYINFSPMTKKWIEDYCTNLGFPIGKTLYKNKTSDYKLQPNEKWTDRKNKGRVEVIIEKGLCCDGEMRDGINLHFYLNLEKNQPKWPWAWHRYSDQLFD